LSISTEEGEMKLGLVVLCCVALEATSLAGEIVVQRLHGDVSARQGVTEVWNKTAVGDVLRPDDTMKTGTRGSAVLLVSRESGESRRVTLPPEVIVDMSDIRDLTQEELMLKLTMEKVRSSSYQWKNDELHISNAAVIHGANKGAAESPVQNDPAVGILQLNGTRFLFENGFYPTCALKAMEVFRLYPELGRRFENRLLVAEALEKANLRGEALNEYGSLLTLDGLTPDQQELVRARMADLKR
jgi:hypothetical protein